MLTTAEDFKGLYYIPNVTDTAPNSNLLGNKPLAMEYVDKYEIEALDILLGIELATLLKPELLKEPFVSGAVETADQKWIDLVNGKSAYKGLREALIAYSFYKFYEDDQSQYTGAGEKAIDSKNMIQIDPTERAVKVWRRYFELTIGESQETTIISKNIGYGIIYGGSSTPYDSLYTFMRDNDDVYPEWEPTYFENINQYGI